ncbi:sporulation membrane protein YtaF [Geomicrobium sp. JCM 19038]|uniref:sporulation membrane protein YtaF n=1 Tax=Geomicrobium sp. JCM 19038 TaxID=1460635 RepID=UPI00045F37F8|nr:sporulation membrane protein YtaF [Geomicrobium sp. JCM 19038]GAK09706.1 membrane protein [Geomicrobium sp. JCM 19038]
MESWIAVLILAFAVSVDGLGVGMTYGMRKMQINWLPLLIIGTFSFTAVLLSGFAATFVFQYLPNAFADYLGGSILILIGVYAIVQAYHHSKTKPEEVKPITKVDQVKEKVVKFEIKKLGLVIQILKKPTAADVDNSGTISVKEAVLLGVALSLDAFGAGFGASMLGYSVVWFALIVSIMCVTFLVIGKKGGYKLSNVRFCEPLVFLPGLLLMCIGIYNFL